VLFQVEPALRVLLTDDQLTSFPQGLGLVRDSAVSAEGPQQAHAAGGLPRRHRDAGGLRGCIAA
jgi:hypothetical protein